MKEDIPKMVAMSHTFAYKDSKGNAVMNSEEYEKNINLAKKFNPTGKLIEKYTDGDKRKELMSGENPFKTVYDDFKSEVDKHLQEYNAEEAKELGAAYKVSDEIIAQKIKLRHQKRVTDKLMKENPYEIAKDFDDLDKQLEAMDANEYNKVEEALYDEYDIIKDNDQKKIIENIDKKRNEIKVKLELEEEKKNQIINDNNKSDKTDIKKETNIKKK